MKSTFQCYVTDYITAQCKLVMNSNNHLKRILHQMNDMEGVKVGVNGEKVDCSWMFVGMTEKNNLDKDPSKIMRT